MGRQSVFVKKHHTQKNKELNFLKNLTDRIKTLKIEPECIALSKIGR